MQQFLTSNEFEGIKWTTVNDWKRALTKEKKDVGKVNLS